MKLSQVLNQDLSATDLEPDWCEQIGQDQEFNGVSLDSRHVDAEQMFVAIKGDRVDGHHYIQASYDKGVSLFMVSREWADQQLAKQRQGLDRATFLVVEDPQVGVANLAVLWRQQQKFTWVAVTGSCGKTSVKEMISAILSSEGSCISTLGNQNNQLGVPLTLLRARAEDKYGVAELGADHQGEIKKTVAWVQPKVALINNVNPAHLDGFGSLEGIAAAKSEIFSTLGGGDVAVLNRDDVFFEFWRQRISDWADQQQKEVSKIITFGEHPDADFRLLSYQAGAPSQSDIRIYGQGQRLNLNLLGKHNQLNALAALAATHYFSIPYAQAATALLKMKPIKGRLRPLSLSDTALVIDDTYNANPGSVQQALNVLQQSAGIKVLVLGDMLELGAEHVQAHASIGEKAAAAGLDALFVMGTDTRYAIGAFNQQVSAQNLQSALGKAPLGMHFDTLDALVDQLKRLILDAESHVSQGDSSKEKVTILIKGSRSMRMERVYEALPLGSEA